MKPEILALLAEISALSELEAVKAFIARNAATIETDSIVAAIVNGKLAELAGFTAARLEKSAERAEENAAETAEKRFAKFHRLALATRYARNLLAQLRADKALPRGGTIVITFDDYGDGKTVKNVFPASLAKHLSDVPADSLKFESVASVKVTLGIARYDENGKRIRKMRKIVRNAEGKAEQITASADVPDVVETEPTA